MIAIIEEAQHFPAFAVSMCLLGLVVLGLSLIDKKEDKKDDGKFSG